MTQTRTILLVGALCALVAVPACRSSAERGREPGLERLDEARSEEAEKTPGVDAPSELPLPTEHWISSRQEKLNKSDRRAWIERMHVTAPGVDWREIERENGEREMRRRAAMASQQSLVPTNWGEIGSANQAGRIHCMAIGPTSGKLYAGADLGGVWRGNVDGTGWVPLADNLYGGSHWLVVLPPENPGEPEVILTATNGGRVRVSRDDGATWQIPVGLPASLASCRGLAVLDDASHTILVYGQYNSSGQKPGVFASTNYGRNFANRWTGTMNFAGWMWVPRKDAGAVSNVYLVQKGQIYTSTNGGTTFTPGTTINASATSAILTGSEAGAPTLYAALNIGGSWILHRSNNAGATWTNVFTMNDVWDGTLCASTIDTNVVMFGGLETWRSTNGGTSFARINTWGSYYGDPAHKLHADTPGIFAWPDPNEPLGSEIWYIGTDGGLYHSLDQGASVLNLSLSGLGVSQYYSTLTSTTAPSLILAGAQDQGYQRGTYVAPSGPGPSTNFSQLISGDYGHLTSSDGSHGVVYCCYPGFILVQQGQSTPSLSQVDFPAGSNHDWLPMVVADPLNVNAFFFCGEKLYRYAKTGSTWTPSIHSTFNFLTGGASYLTAVGISRTNPQRMYASNSSGRLFYSSNHGVNWTESVNTGPIQHYFYGNTLAVHPIDALEAVIGGSGYSAPGVRRTTDGGVTWTAITTGLPATQVYDLVYAENGTGDVFAATEAGAYQWVRSSGTWVNIMQSGTPITTYWSVESVANGAKIRFGTYARGIWDYTIPGTGPQARWLVYGTGLGGANTLTLDTLTNPHIGTNVVLDVVSPIAASRAGWIYTSDFGGSVPFQGGTMLVSPVTNFFRVRVESNGRGSARYPIPNDPALIGVSRYFQAILVEPTQPQGFALSNGLEAQFGP